MAAIQTKITITPADAGDARSAPSRVISVDVFLVDAPLGSISADPAVWRQVDESAVGSAAAERLAKNGVRCGLARRVDSQLLSDLLGRASDRVRRQSFSGVGVEEKELDLRRKVRSQTILFLDDGNQLVGRTFDDCEDGMTLKFRPTPRQPGYVRLTLCPTIDVPRQLLRYTAGQVELGVPSMEAARVYEASLSADVPDDGFLVIAPGPTAARATSIGGQFFTRDDPTQRTELVIVIVPTTLPLNGKPTDILAVPSR